MTTCYLEIPSSRPATPLLDNIDQPSQLQALDEASLEQLADELRAFLLYTVGTTGGHFGAGLGVVELTIALHHVFNTPEDRLVWDVGHQTYPHKILTGRRDQLHTIRKRDGLSGFPRRDESPYDTFGVGHSSTSLSAALGMALAAQMDGSERRTVAVIGDGAMTAGMAFEALNHIAHEKPDMLVVLNDNNMSISKNVGGLATYFSKLWSSRVYNLFRESAKTVLRAFPSTKGLVRKTEELLKAMVAPGIIFEELGFTYIGPVDGHNLPLLVHTLQNLREQVTGPVLLHVATQKGKGYAPAEQDPIGYHAINKRDASAAPTAGSTPQKSKPATIKYQQIFGDWLCDMAAQDANLVGITPAMSEGSGMVEFARRFPTQFHDVAIAEQHAVTLAAGLACEGKKPVVAIYSTFLQRAYDQLIHDVALQNLDVLFAIDRAGLVGEDGATHAGIFDLSFLRCVPNMVVMVPADENEARQMLYTGYMHKGPAAVRYPRGGGPGVVPQAELTELEIGKARTCRDGRGVAILNFGALLTEAELAAQHVDATLIDMRFVKPLDHAILDEITPNHNLVVTVEENTIAGGAGSAVGEYYTAQGSQIALLHLGIPDYFMEHDKQQGQRGDAGLDAQGLIASIEARMHQLGLLEANPALSGVNVG